jgi:hypothetical protein
MNIGDIVWWRGRRYRLLGFSRKSLPETEAQLEDAETGQWASAPVDEVEPEEPGDAGPPGPVAS